MSVTTQRNEAIKRHQDMKRRFASLKGEHEQTVAKLSKLTHEKKVLERDQRATLSLAKSLEEEKQGRMRNSSGHYDVDYYKRKVGSQMFIF